jgi:DNA-damage-inducible protein D
MLKLGYVDWRNMETAIDRARASCQALGHDPADHFVGATKVVPFGKGGVSGQDYELTRYACYLVAMNGDPHKPEIAAAQHYFAAMTRAAEVMGPAQADLPARRHADPALPRLAGQAGRGRRQGRGGMIQEDP